MKAEYVSSPLLAGIPALRHGFFTRRGGVSEGIYASLNAGYGSGDDVALVAENRARIAEALGCEKDALCTAYQIHSDKVAVLSEPWHWREAQEADALVTKTSGIALGVLTADCVPVLFCDPEARVIGAAHAGWKGAMGGVLEATLVEMQKLGARRSAILTAIGPAIAKESYQTGPEFFERFVQETASNALFFSAPDEAGKRYFDLPDYVRHRLLESGVAEINLLANDTCCEEDAFFSFRRATLRGEKAYGRQISALMLT